jgi:peroxiredoxin
VRRIDGVDRTVFRLAFALLIGAVWTLAATAPTLAAAEQQQVGDRVIDFELPVVGSDAYLVLSDEYDQGAVVVVVLRGYPGYQCPVCRRQVGSLANRAKGLTGQAHRVILVYPGEGTELKRHSQQFMGSRSLPQPLVMVRDDEMKMVDSWGLRWNALKETAYPATYVIDRNGRIRWKKVSDSHAGRSTVEEILKELRKL